jgi:hypothetical protein
MFTADLDVISERAQYAQLNKTAHTHRKILHYPSHSIGTNIFGDCIFHFLGLRYNEHDFYSYEL